MKKLNLLLLVGGFIFLMLKVSAQQWDVPADKKDKNSPFRFTAETSVKGESVFKQNCQVCHGEPTKGTYNKGLIPVPGDPATDKFQKQTDGALFYKITTGRGAMPQFRDILTEEQHWQAISYFRSFNKSYVQPENELKEGSSVEVQNVFLSLTFIPVNNQVKALATDKYNKPVRGAEVGLFVKRYFGKMKIGESVNTDSEGIAVFDFPKDLPGDKKGNVIIIADINIGGTDIQKIDTFSIGIPTNKPPLTSGHAMWNVMSKAPVWLLLSYFIVVAVIWGFIIFIVMQLVKLRKRGQMTEDREQKTEEVRRET